MMEWDGEGTIENGVHHHAKNVAHKKGAQLTTIVAFGVDLETNALLPIVFVGFGFFREISPPRSVAHFGGSNEDSPRSEREGDNDGPRFFVGRPSWTLVAWLEEN